LLWRSDCTQFHDNIPWSSCNRVRAAVRSSRPCTRLRSQSSIVKQALWVSLFIYIWPTRPFEQTPCPRYQGRYAYQRLWLILIIRAAISSGDEIHLCITPKIELSIRVLCNVLECSVEVALGDHDANMVSRGSMVSLCTRLYPLPESPKYHVSLFFN
jgi:hypothetical protein